MIRHLLTTSYTKQAMATTQYNYYSFRVYGANGLELLSQCSDKIKKGHISVNTSVHLHMQTALYPLTL